MRGSVISRTDGHQVLAVAAFRYSTIRGRTGTSYAGESATGPSRYFARLIRYAAMIVPYFTSMFGTSHSGNCPSRR